MCEKKERLTRRNRDVKSMFNSLCKKHPQWRIDAIISAVSNKFYLSEITIESILKEKGVYKEYS